MESSAMTLAFFFVFLLIRFSFGHAKSAERLNAIERSRFERCIVWISLSTICQREASSHAWHWTDFKNGLNFTNYFCTYQYVVLFGRFTFAFICAISTSFFQFCFFFQPEYIISKLKPGE